MSLRTIGIILFAVSIVYWFVEELIDGNVRARTVGYMIIGTLAVSSFIYKALKDKNNKKK